MTDNYTKLSIQGSLNQLAETRALEQIQNTGRALPCKVAAVNGPIVTVSFQVTAPQVLQPIAIPVAESQWLRAPVQVGDLGVTMPADTFLGGVSGLGSGTADLTVNYGNLSTLCFVPVGNVGFPTMPDPNRAWINGPNGFDITDTSQFGGIRWDKETQTLTLFAGENTIVLTADPSLVTTIVTAFGNLQTIVDGANNAISFVPANAFMPQPIIALGKIYTALDNTRAVAANADLTSVINGGSGVLGNMLPALMNAVGLAIGSSSSTWATAQAALQAIFTASTFVSSISGIEASIPICSSIVRVAP